MLLRHQFYQSLITFPHQKNSTTGLLAAHQCDAKSFLTDCDRLLGHFKRFFLVSLFLSSRGPPLPNVVHGLVSDRHGKYIP